MQDISTILRGRIGSEPMMKHIKGDVCVTTFRLAMTKWRLTSDVRTGNASYMEGGAYWYTVETQGTLTSNVFRSCRKGNPVVVVARPILSGWIDGNGWVRSSIVYRASLVGHDLARGTSRFMKNGAHATDEPAGGTQGDPYPTRQGSGSAVTVQAGEHRSSLGTDVYAHVATPDQETDILPNEAAPSQSEPMPRVSTGAVGVKLSVLPALEEHERSEEQSSDPGRSSLPRLDYSTLEGGHADATKNDAFEPPDGDADEPPDAA